MSAQAVKAAGKAAGKVAEGHVLKKGAKRDPELYVCGPRTTFTPELLYHLTKLNSYANVLSCIQVLLGVMSGAFGLAGFYFGRLPIGFNLKSISIQLNAIDLSI